MNEYTIKITITNMITALKHPECCTYVKNYTVYAENEKNAYINAINMIYETKSEHESIDGIEIICVL